ncbi:hypothetical protein [Nitrospira sp. Nam74]
MNAWTKAKMSIQENKWLEVWRDLAQLTRTIPKGDKRLDQVLALLESADHAYGREDWPAMLDVYKRIAEVTAPPVVMEEQTITLALF